MSRRRSLSDPLSRALQPPPDESAQAREKRLKDEAAAKKVSDAIDEQIKLDKAERAARRKKEVKVLLLGQSESGKSTTLKQFQIIYAPNQFRSERAAWRAVVYLNLVRSIRRILEALLPDEEPTSPTLEGRTSSDFPNPDGVGTSSISFTLANPQMTYGPNDKYADIRHRLTPLLSLEDTLIRNLAPPEEDEATHLGPWGKKKEVFVRSGVPWKKALGKLGKKKESEETEEVEYDTDPDDPVHVLNACRGDMIALWRDPEVQEILKQRKLRLEESSGFYLNDIERITSLKYAPTDDDVLKARLKTVGVMEHVFQMDKGHEKGIDWRIYDVGGARSQRQAWSPYFDDCNAIIFLAPISAFDQVLAEDPSVNRVEDTLLLWRSLVANKLLANTNIVLFLNKCDLLEKKLAAGVRLARYMTSYGDRPNDYESISKYFRSKFTALHRSYSPNQNREIYMHLTCVTDIRQTAAIIANVRDIILRDNLKSSSLI